MIKENFIEIYENSFKSNWDLLALTDYVDKKRYLYKDLAREIARLHILFEKNGVERGDKIALVGKNDIQWCAIHLGTMFYGAVIVPILQDFHADSIQYIIAHSDSKLLFVSDQIWESLDVEQMPKLEAAFSLTDTNFLFRKGEQREVDSEGSLNMEMLNRYPNGYSIEDINYQKTDNSEVVLINYTSGTTGFSKGVMLTANNLAGNITYSGTLNVLARGEQIVSFLPLAHAYGAAFEFLYALSAGAHTVLLGKIPSPNILLQAFSEYKPSLIVTVPLVIEKVYKKTILPQINKPIVKMALAIPFLRRRIYAKICKKLVDSFGGNFCQVIIGGAAINQEVEAFLYKIKFPFTVGYGMTECGPLISYDRYCDFVPNSCGQILKRIMEVRVDSSDPYNILGEIQVKGENVMRGYYKNEKDTKEAFTKDGWLRTGDLGTIDKDNRIFLRGRSKTMILGPNGQNIFPEEIESKLNNMPYVLESLVILKNNKLIALIYPDLLALEADELSIHDLPALMETNKSDINTISSTYERLSSVEICEQEFEKTPKKSIKRYLYDK